MVTDEYPISVEENAYNTGITIISHELGLTSGILYADFGVDMSNISYEDVRYLQLFELLLESVGINNSTFAKGNYSTINKLIQFIGMDTYKFWVSQW